MRRVTSGNLPGSDHRVGRLELGVEGTELEGVLRTRGLPDGLDVLDGRVPAVVVGVDTAVLRAARGLAVATVVVLGGCTNEAQEPEPTPAPSPTASCRPTASFSSG